MKSAIATKAAPVKKAPIRIAVVESDPLRFVGFRALFDNESDFELISASLPDLGSLQGIDLILLGNRNGQNLFDVMATMKVTRPDLRIIVTGSGIDEETILKAIASGAKGYVDEAASPTEFVQAIRVVNEGSVWAPRRVLSMFIAARIRTSASVKAWQVSEVMRNMASCSDLRCSGQSVQDVGRDGTVPGWDSLGK